MPLINRVFIRDTTIENKSAVQNPETLKFGTIFAASIISKAFITKENNPNVRIVRGRVNKVIIGLMKIFIIPSTTAKTMAEKIVMVTPGIKYAANKIANVEITQ